jgi:hypothetical protein
MNCDETKTLMAGYWSGSLEEAEELAFDAHIAGCEPCRAEAGRLGSLWKDLARLPAEEPGEALRNRFYEALGAYRQGLESGGGWEQRVAWPWPRRPLWQMAAGLALLAGGLAAGYAIHPNQPDPEIAAVRKEVTQMRQMVALSLLQQQSASERLRGVSWAYRAESSDTEVMQALVSAIQHDESVNVRLAAVDALRAFAESPAARRAAVESLPRQNAPLVQVALIDLLVDLQDRDAVANLNTLASSGDVNDMVKERALWALGELR